MRKDVRCFRHAAGGIEALDALPSRPRLVVDFCCMQPKCTWAEYGRQPRNAREPTSSVEAPNRERRTGDLDGMQELTGSACMRVLGAQVQIDEGWRTEMEAIRAKAWAAFHMRRRMWLAKGSHMAKVRMMHL